MTAINQSSPLLVRQAVGVVTDTQAAKGTYPHYTMCQQVGLLRLHEILFYISYPPLAEIKSLKC